MTARNYIDVVVERDSEFCAVMDGSVTVYVEQGLRGLPGIGTLAELLAMLASLDEYDSDESAAAAGVAYKGYYNASDSHVTEKGGALCQNRIP